VQVPRCRHVPALHAVDRKTQVDVIFDESFAPASGNLLDLPAFTAAYGPGAASLPAVAAGRVYAFNNRLSKGADNSVGSDWFETSVARPDLVRCWGVRVAGSCVCVCVCVSVCVGVHAVSPSGACCTRRAPSQRKHTQHTNHRKPGAA
jgi:hypothetical protein